METYELRDVLRMNWLSILYTHKTKDASGDHDYYMFILADSYESFIFF